MIVFQYNPENLSRTLQAQSSGGEGERGGVRRFKGAPVETLSLEIEIDATDQLEKANPVAVGMGVLPQLAALELVLYPHSDMVIKNTALANLGFIQIEPPAAPLTLFIYGLKRILPVQVTDFKVSEEAHDTVLNPIRAKVTLGLRVLSYNDLLPDHPGYAVYLSHQIAKETMARVAMMSSLDAVGISKSPLG